MLSKELINDIQLYINSLYISLEKQEFPVIRSGSLFDKCKGAFGIDDEEFDDEELFDEELMTESLEDFLQKQDVSFSEYLLDLIDERGLTDAQCYKSANLSRQLFSKIRTEKAIPLENVRYLPWQLPWSYHMTILRTFYPRQGIHYPTQIKEIL